MTNGEKIATLERMTSSLRKSMDLLMMKCLPPGTVIKYYSMGRERYGKVVLSRSTKLKVKNINTKNAYWIDVGDVITTEG